MFAGPRLEVPEGPLYLHPSWSLLSPEYVRAEDLPFCLRLWPAVLKQAAEGGKQREQDLPFWSKHLLTADSRSRTGDIKPFPADHPNAHQKERPKLTLSNLAANVRFQVSVGVLNCV